MVSTNWIWPRVRAASESSVSSASAVSRGRPALASPIATPPKCNLGVGRILRSIAPPTVTGVPAASDSLRSIKARWLFQSIT